ncbi:hypothetical protein OAU26_03760 [Mariniblastus sp.]|nr:hypothetical protein [Mariniblastus sp.]
MIPSIRGCSVPGDQLHCPLCRYAQTAPAKRIAIAHANLVGTVAPNALYNTLLRMYKDEVQMTDESIGVLTVSQIETHFTEHAVGPHTQIASDIMFTACLQKHIQQDCIATPDGDGVHISAPSVNDWVKLSKHKLTLLQTYANLLKSTETAPSAKPYNFD